MPSSHLRKVFDPEQLRRIATETEKLRIELRAEIVCVRGLSGTLAASAMSAMFATPFAVVRKSNEVSHGRSVELVDSYDFDDRVYQDWIIVDDLIASGATVKAIRYAVDNYSPECIRGRCKGVVLYHDTKGPEERSVGDGLVVPVFYIGGKI